MAISRSAVIGLVIVMIPLSLGNATSVLVGQALGAGQAQRARKICWDSIRLGMSPLSTSHGDVVEALVRLRDLVARGVHTSVDSARARIT